MENTKRYIAIVVALIVIVVALIVLFGGDRDEITPRVVAPISNVVRITLENVDSDQILSPGVYVVHDDSVSLDFMGKMAPDELEPLAEYGNHDAFLNYVGFLDGVVEVIAIYEPIFPGEQEFFDLDLSGLSGPLYLSGIQMAVGSNDGYALLDSELVLGKDNRIRAFVTSTNNYDAGTEENLPLLSGFFGGQPSVAYSEFNAQSGTPTVDVVTAHDQLTRPILRVIAQEK